MKICIIGSGYVGLVTAACFAEMGNNVTCVDVNPEIVEKLKSGQIHIYEPGLDAMVRRSSADGRLKFTTDVEMAVASAECVFICVGTPTAADGSCELGYVRQAAMDIGKYMQGDLVVVDKSTVPVGTADVVRGLILEELKKRGVEWRVEVVSNPEFLKEGDAIADFMKPDRVVIGASSQDAADLMRELYAPFARTRDKIIVMTVRSAEMTKYAANCMLATKISFINEIANVCEAVGADIREVRVGIGSDSRIGYQFIHPGPGFGGSCFPKDVKALIETARAYGETPELLQAVDGVNARQKRRMADVVERYFAPQGGVKGKSLAVWGLSFKANTDDMREAPAIDIVGQLTSAGMKIRAYDPVASDNARKIFSGNDLVEICSDQYEACRGADGLLVVTEWNQFRNPDFMKIRDLLQAPVIFDGRNLYSPEAMGKRGFAYFCLGRRAANKME